MKRLIIEIIRRVSLIIGIKIIRTERGIFGCKSLSGVELKNNSKWIQNMNIKTIIDVGAHEGESALHLHRLIPEARIYSFEPLADCFVRLNINMSNVPNFKSFNLALGDKKGTLQMHRSEFSDSSSLLKMAKLHQEAFPFSAGETLENVNADTLDNMAQELELEDDILLKVDVQGYESKVIHGSSALLKRIKVIIIETSFQELYEGQPQFSDIYELLTRRGFIYSGSWAELTNPLDGAHLQQDSIFIRK